MAVTLYDASIPNYLQTLAALSGILDKGLAHCRDAGRDPDELVEARLVPDMRPFRFQVTSVVHHSLDTIEAIQTGTFRAPTDRTPYDYAGLQDLLRRTHAVLAAVAREDVDARAGADLVLDVGGTQRLFTTESFVLSYSLPNFYFHAATAYDILRVAGVAIGKRDFTGALRLKSA